MELFNDGKNHYTYVMIKLDGMPHVMEIISLIQEAGLEVSDAAVLC